jgi:hypothetical protein
MDSLGFTVSLGDICSGVQKKVHHDDKSTEEREEEEHGEEQEVPYVK